MSLTRLFEYNEKEIGEELMAVTAEVEAIVTRLNALASALPAYVAAQVSAAEAVAAQNHVDDVAAVSTAVAPLEAVVEPAPAPAPDVAV